jgi:hypothetical protein
MASSVVAEAGPVAADLRPISNGSGTAGRQRERENEPKEKAARHEVKMVPEEEGRR